MSTFLPLLGIVALIAAGTYGTGRLLVAAANVRWLRRITIENVFASAFLGTSFWMITTGVCSYAGLPAPQAAIVLGVLCALLLAVVLLQRRGEWLLPTWKPQVNVPVIGLFLLAAVVSMYTVIYAHCFDTFNDSPYYITASELLQKHSVGGGVETDPSQPLIYPRDLLLSGWFHNGALYFFSLIQALFASFLAFELYPAVMCWGLMMNIGGIYVLARWALRLPTPYALFAAVMALVAVNPLSFSHDIGFLCQVYGTFSLSFALAVTSRLYARTNWRYGSAMVFALAVCGVLSAYSEMAPFLALGCFVYVGQVLWRARQRGLVGRFAIFFAQTACALLLFGNVEFRRTIKNLLATMDINGVGYPHPWTALDFWGFALGLKPRQMDMNAGLTIATMVGTVCCILGVVKILSRSRQAVPLGVALGVFGMLAMYYYFLVKDPWSGALGHTWNLFKLCKWAFPLVVTLQVGGLYYLLRRLPHHRKAIIACGIVGVAVCLPYRFEQLRIQAGVETARVGQKPLKSARELRHKLDVAGATDLYFVQDPVSVHPRWLTPALFHTRSFLNSWQNEVSLLGTGLDQERLSEATDKTYFFMGGEPAFETPYEKLPLGYSRVDPQHTCVLYINGGNGLERYPNGNFTWLRDTPTMLRIWSPGDATFAMHFDIEAGPSINNSQTRNIQVYQDGDKPQDFVVEQQGHLTANVRLTKGLNTVMVQCLDKPNCQVSPQDPRTLLAKLSNVTLDQKYPNAPATSAEQPATATRSTGSPK